jgi:hypothetical protein
MISVLVWLILPFVGHCVLYSITPEYKIVLQPTSTELAHCYYLEKIRESGWNRFYIHANPQVNMLDQYRGAGFLEGYATYKEIYYAYNNFYKSLVLNGNPNINIKAKNFAD